MFWIKLTIILIFGVVTVEPTPSTRWGKVQVVISSTACRGGASNRRNHIPLLSHSWNMLQRQAFYKSSSSLVIRGGSSNHVSVEHGVITTGSLEQQKNDEEETYMGYDFCDDMTMEERKQHTKATSESDTLESNLDNSSKSPVRPSEPFAEERTENSESLPYDEVLIATSEELKIGTGDQITEEQEENMQRDITTNADLASQLTEEDSMDNDDEAVNVSESDNKADVSVDGGSEELNNSEETVAEAVEPDASSDESDVKTEESTASNSDNNDDDDNNKASNNSTNPVGDESVSVGTTESEAADASAVDEQIITAEVAVEQEIYYETTENVEKKNSDNFDAWESEVESASVPDNQSHHLDQTSSTTAEAAVAAADLAEAATIPKDVRAVLIKQLKYRRQEVNLMKPAIAAFVAERSLTRPPEGIPHNWYIDGAVPVQSEDNGAALAKLRNVVLPIVVGAIGIYFFTAGGKPDISIMEDVIDKVVSKIKAIAFGKKKKALEGKEKVDEAGLD